MTSSWSTWWKLQRRHPPHGGVRAPEAVEVGQQRPQRGRVVVVPRLQLVLLGVAVLLLVGRRVRLAQLVARVHPPARRHGGGEHRSGREGVTGRVAQRVGEDVGRRGPEVRPEPAGTRGVGQLLAVAGQLPLRPAPGEVGVRLAEPDLGQAVHHRRVGERLGQEHQVGSVLEQVGDGTTARTRAAWCGGCRPGTPTRPGRSRTGTRSRHACHSALRSASSAGQKSSG